MEEETKFSSDYYNFLREGEAKLRENGWGIDVKRANGPGKCSVIAGKH